MPKESSSKNEQKSVHRDQVKDKAMKPSADKAVKTVSTKEHKT